jgi:dihydrofolate reductase
MGKVVVGAFVTVDGVMQAPGAPDEDREGGFEHGGWTVPYWNDELGQLMGELTNRGDALLLGRKTYEIFAASWPNAEPDDPIGAKLNSMPKYVASRTLDRVDWTNSTLLGDDLRAEVEGLKEQYGHISVTGSSGLIQSLLKEDLVDEFQLLVFPVVIGTGKRLFGDGTIPGALRLVDTRGYPTGVAVHTYERAGDLEYGSFEVGESES